MSIHVRSSSMQDFREQGTQAASNLMKSELNKLAHLIPQPDRRKQFENEQDRFMCLFNRYLLEYTTTASSPIDWEKIKSPGPNLIRPYNGLPDCPDTDRKQLLNKLAVLKLNGGLGTTMGCVGPKSAIEVRDGLTFLDLTVRQLEYLNVENDAATPLLLMNSFNTDEETNRIIQKYSNHRVNIVCFNQSRYPRINKDTLLPVPRHPDKDKNQWYPPGHGDVFEALYNTGQLQKLLDQGYEYIFISNVDNLGATVDTRILKHMVDSKAEFLMEVTDKTRADVKGGTLIDYDGRVRLLEIAQVPAEHVDDFKSVKKFQIFNTNNIWISLKAIKRVVEQDELELEIIVNPKTISETGEKVIQLETAVGAAVKHFQGAHGVNVPRSRFLPVKSTDDLFLVQSDLYKLEHGQLVLNPKRQFASVPLIKMGDEFRKVHNFLARFKSPPHILELDHLTVTGDVTFGSGVHLKGTVIIVANHGNRIDIPSGSILENKVVSGNLRILDH